MAAPIKKNTLIVLVGPTAVGKTTTSIQLAKHFNTEIISADSRQFYREMSIGTAKPTSEEMDGIAHHFVDFIPVTQDYNAGDFERDVLQKLEELFQQHKTIIMVGGSGLYINAVCEGMDGLPSDDGKTRKELNTLFQNEGIIPLQEKLKELDPDYYEIVDQSNHTRLIRALEVSIISGKPYSTLRTANKKERDFNIIKIGLEMDREVLYNRINFRVDQMIKAGLIEEATNLLSYRNLNALQTVGYREIFDAIDKTITMAEAIELIKRNSRRYAKRQMTWFKKDEETIWFGTDQVEEITHFIQNHT
jgi:tRNA dimethylallyltransferase